MTTRTPVVIVNGSATTLPSGDTLTPSLLGSNTPGSGNYLRGDGAWVNPWASPSLTGSPTAPTPAAGDSSTSLATTAFVATSFAPLASPTFTGTLGMGTQGSKQSFALSATAGSPSSVMFTYGTDGTGWMMSFAKNQAGTLTTQMNIRDNGNVTIGNQTNDNGYTLGVTGTGNFTGALSAPTAAVNTNTTQVATTAFVLAQASSTTPAALGTAAVGTSTTFARADHVHALQTTSTTQAQTDNSTKIATTAFVQLFNDNNVTAVSAATTLTAAKAGLIDVTASAAYTITMPAVATKGLNFTFYRNDNTAFAVTIARASTTENFVGFMGTATSLTLPASTQYAVINIMGDGTNWVVTSSNLSPALLGTVKIGGGALANRSAVTYAATMTLDCSTADTFDITLTGNPTINFSNARDGQRIEVRLIQDATGGRTVTWGTMCKFGSQFASVTLSTAANATDYIGVVYSAAAAKYHMVSYNLGF